jgi:hypothetical protein
MTEAEIAFKALVEQSLRGQPGETYQPLDYEAY